MYLPALLLLLAASLSGAQRWESQYFHDLEGEEMGFSSIGFCSPTRGVALGGLTRRGSFKPLALATSDSGKTWTRMPLDEPGYGVFFLDETSGWMLTPSGIWFTDECGRTWRRIHKQRGLSQVRFISRDRGWAVGANKTAIETSDGGKSWTKVKEVVALDMNAERTTFGVVEPLTQKSAIMVGRSSPPRVHRTPLWLDPHPERRREVPALTVTLETRDAGATWNASKASMFGRVSAIRVSEKAQGILLIEFDEFFDYPSELYALDVLTGQNTLSLRRKDFAVTDVAAGQGFYAAGFQPPGAVFRSPVPGKVRIAYSVDAKTWTECEVDYRAVATRVMLAQSGGKFWAATDTGMILTLVQE